jgi:hypothetical protein
VKIVYEGDIECLPDGSLMVTNFHIQDDEAGKATMQALIEYAWLVAMERGDPVQPLPVPYRAPNTVFEVDYSAEFEVDP